MKREKTDRHERRHYKTKRWSAVVLLAWLAPAPGVRASDGIRVEMLHSPAPAESLTPFLAGSKSLLYLSWLEKTPEGHRLRLSSWDGARFTEPVTVHASDRFFANWADFASVLPFGESRVAVHWLEKSSPGTYHYDVLVSVSDDGGKTWASPSRPHRDGTLSEHGFVSLVPAGPSGFAAVWLDGRNFAKDSAVDEMTLRFTHFDGMSYGGEQLLDGRVCECCQTGMAATEQGFFVAYRDRSPDEIRDIAYVRFGDGEWTEPRRIASDDWHLTGCPVNGPQVAAEGARLAVAWFTASRDEPRVQIAFSRDGGGSFGEQIRVDDGRPLGRVDVELLGEDAVVSWLTSSEGKGAEVRVRRVSPSGTRSESVAVALTGSDRASGFPRMASFQKELYLAWTESHSRADPSQVRFARLVLE